MSNLEIMVSDYFNPLFLVMKWVNSKPLKKYVDQQLDIRRSNLRGHGFVVDADSTASERGVYLIYEAPEADHLQRGGQLQL